LGIGDYYYTIAEMVRLGVFTGFFYCSRSVVNSYRPIVADTISIDICHNHERKLESYATTRERGCRPATGWGASAGCGGY
jgi:hypothetical protein